jgi:cytochrome P460
MGGMKSAAVVIGLAYGVSFSVGVRAQQAPGDGPRYVNGTNLVRPADYREWIFLGAGLDMAYNPPPSSDPSSSPRPERHTFTNVFVNPSSYRSFMQTGKWPDRTIFVLEARDSGSEASINRAGRFQAGFTGLEGEVKDSRFPDGWAFFRFNGTAASAEPLSGEPLARGQCVECHTSNTAVERTFVQFYPTLLEVARRKGTLKPGF